MDLPSGGVPPLIDTPAGFHAAASALAAGQGPIAVDTERASGFRYDDRAFLLQIRRRGVGRFTRWKKAEGSVGWGRATPTG